MIISLDDAQELYENLPPTVIAPTLSPSYVQVDLLREEGPEAVFFLYREDKSFFLLPFHMRYVEGYGFFDVQSQYGYGGPCFNSNDDSFLSRAWAKFFAWCIENKVLVCFFRFHPLLENERMFPGTVMENRQTVYVKLGNNYFDDFQPKNRGKTRSLQRMGVQFARLDCTKEESMHAFLAAYTETMAKTKASSEYIFCKAYWEALFKLSSTQLYLASKDNAALCYILALVNHSTIAEYFFATSTQSGYELGAMAFLIKETCSFLIKEEKSFLNLGGGADQENNSNLLMFKKKFSQHTAPYKIGSLILNNDGYETLKNSLNYNGNRVIFYR